MANLIDAKRPYLHNKKWNFFNYCNDQIPQLRNGYDLSSDKYIRSLISRLEGLKSHAEEREQKFYDAFGVKDNIKWAEQYLIPKEGKLGNLQQTILRIINSKEMFNILAGDDGTRWTKDMEEEFKKAIAVAERSIGEAAQSENFQKAITQVVEDFSWQSISQVAKSLSSNKNGDALFKNWESELMRAILGDAKKSFRISLNEKYQKNKVKEMKSVIRKKFKVGNSEKITKSVAYLRSALASAQLKDGTTISADVIEKIVAQWEKHLRSNSERSNRLLSDENSNITGEIGESNDIIAYIRITVDGENYNFDKVYAEGFSDKVKRVGQNGNTNNVSSKIDMVWTAPNGEQFLFQNKNSLTSWEDYGINSTVDNTFGRPVELKLNDGVKLTTLEEQLMATSVVTQNDIALLSYLLVNLNVLNKFSLSEEDVLHKGKGKKKGKDGKEIPMAEKTQVLVSSILSSAVQFFCADTIELNGKFKFDKTYDFINYKSRYLIPMSVVYNSLIISLTDYFKAVMRIWITTRLDGYSTQEFDTLWVIKHLTMMDEPKNVPHDYHNEQLVEAGQDEGEKVLNLIQVNPIRLKIFNPKEFFTNNVLSGGLRGGTLSNH